MTITEVIERLEEIRAEYGDLPVIVSAYDESGEAVDVNVDKDAYDDYLVAYIEDDYAHNGDGLVI